MQLHRNRRLIFTNNGGAPRDVAEIDFSMSGLQIGFRDSHPRTFARPCPCELSLKDLVVVKQNNRGALAARETVHRQSLTSLILRNLRGEVLRKIWPLRI